MNHGRALFALSTNLFNIFNIHWLLMLYPVLYLLVRVNVPTLYLSECVMCSINVYVTVESGLINGIRLVTS